VPVRSAPRDVAPAWPSAPAVARGGKLVPVIDLDLAKQLRAAGLEWAPANGDRFVVPDRDMDDEIFVLSDMTVEIHEFPSGRIIGFNGTTEWALDSIEQQDVIWLPREDQLRALIGPRFQRLETVPGGFAAVLELDGREQRHIDIDAERAYARCLLALLRF
jgi:hypothetical protein